MAYLTGAPITWPDLSERLRALAQAGPGAVVTFLGIVRPDEEPGRCVAALEYEAYPAMAEAQFTAVIQGVRRQWPEATVWLQHRLGVVPVGDISVAVLAAAAHRVTAYAASQFVVERLKTTVPIWKKVHYDDATQAWWQMVPTC